MICDTIFWPSWWSCKLEINLSLISLMVWAEPDLNIFELSLRTFSLLLTDFLVNTDFVLMLNEIFLLNNFVWLALTSGKQSVIGCSDL